MALQYHPDPGTIVICDFAGFVEPEMIKRRPAVVISPRLRRREGLCTIVPLSTTPPAGAMPYHLRLDLDPPLPKPYTARTCWVKGDMFCTVSFARLRLPFKGRGLDGKRIYETRVLDPETLRKIQACAMHALGLERLTVHL